MVVVAIADPVRVPFSVRVPTVEADGTKLNTSDTLPEPAPTNVAESVQAAPVCSPPRTLFVKVHPLVLPPVTLKLVVLVTVFEPVMA